MSQLRGLVEGETKNKPIKLTIMIIIAMIVDGDGIDLANKLTIAPFSKIILP